MKVMSRFWALIEASQDPEVALFFCPSTRKCKKGRVNKDNRGLKPKVHRNWENGTKKINMWNRGKKEGRGQTGLKDQ